MLTIGESSINTFCPETGESTKKKNTEIRKSQAVPVSSYFDLVTKVAQLQYSNRDYVLLFRGQKEDYKNAHKNTSIKPTIFRSQKGNPSSEDLRKKFDKLDRAERELVEEYRQRQLPRSKEISKRQILRWSILQHYEICETPLLDVTHSLRIAASFASDHSGNTGYIFVLGVPNISGAITASAEAEIQIVRLASVCPPQAMRPHIQEGYLLGEYPDIRSYEQKQLYQAHEVDFGKRLVAKFVFQKNEFWNNALFPIIERQALYPQGDPMTEIADAITSKLEEHS